MKDGLHIQWNNREIVFYKSNIIDDKLKIENQLVFKNTLEICLYMYQLSVDIDLQSTKLGFPVNLRDISRFFNTIDYKKMCRDGSSLMHFPSRYPMDFIYHMIKVTKYFSFCLIIYYLEICVWTVVLKNNTLWRDIKCPIIMDNIKKKMSILRFFDLVFPQT